MIGHIILNAKKSGKPTALNLHGGFDEAGAGNIAGNKDSAYAPALDPTRLSMTEQIMELVAKIPKLTIGQFIARFTRALQADNINEYCATFRDYLKLIPHNIIVDREKFFQSIFYATALLIDSKAIASEIATDRGFIDIVIHGDKKTFLMEFKKDKSPEVAMQQILDKKYYEKLVIDGNRVTLVGINFDLEADGVEVAWLVKELQ